MKYDINQVETFSACILHLAFMYY